MDRRVPHTLQEQHNKMVEQVSKLVCSVAKSYVQIEGYSVQTAIEIALSDFSFWYSEDKNKEELLRGNVYAKFK